MQLQDLPIRGHQIEICARVNDMNEVVWVHPDEIPADEDDLLWWMVGRDAGATELTVRAAQWYHSFGKCEITLTDTTPDQAVILAEMLAGQHQAAYEG